MSWICVVFTDEVGVGVLPMVKLLNMITFMPGIYSCFDSPEAMTLMAYANLNRYINTTVDIGWEVDILETIFQYRLWQIPSCSTKI